MHFLLRHSESDFFMSFSLKLIIQNVNFEAAFASHGQRRAGVFAMAGRDSAVRRAMTHEGIGG